MEITWVTKWVDYSNKYGFGFQLSSDALGVLFNDASRIIMAPDGRCVKLSACLREIRQIVIIYEIVSNFIIAS